MSERPDLEFRPVTAARWSEFEALFESRGAPHYCWCMAWRTSDAAASGPERKLRLKSSMERRIKQGDPVGILGYLDDRPVAWCSIAPRSGYKPLGGIETALNVWSLTCFFLKRPLRGKGLARNLLGAAVEHARQNGADLVEAYPIDKGTSYRFMGYRTTFEAAGFEFIKMAGTKRNVMVLHLKEN